MEVGEKRPHSTQIPGSVGAIRKQGIKAERTGRQESNCNRDSNENQLGDPGAGELKLSLDGSLSQADPSDYHWCEEEDLSSETVDSSSCADQEITAQSLPSGKEISDPHYVALAQEIDSHLAHIDMEEFKSEDMHSLLLDAADPCKAAVLSAKQTCETSYSQDDCSLTDGSLCKSGPLFSPQRVVNHPEFSTDSLNSDEKEEWLEEAEREARNLLLAVDCKTNVTNYTLAWSSGTDGDYNEPGSSSSGSDHSHWSSSGGGCGIRTVSRYAPPIPPWPSRPGISCATWPRVDRTINAVPSYPIVHNFQTLQGGSPLKKSANLKGRLNQLNNSNQLCNQSTEKTRDNLDNTQPLDADNGNEELACKDGRPAEKAKDRGADDSSTTTEGLSLLQIYMRQKSGSALKSPKVDESDVIASGGGEGWVEDYPSSVDGKLSSDSETSCSSNDNKGGARSMTLTDASDIEQSSLQIDAQPFNCSHKLNTSCGTASSLDKLIAKIKPFEIGLSPGSIEEHWNFHTGPKKDEKGCQTLPASSNDKSTSTEPSSASSPNVYVIFPSYSMPDLSFLRNSQYQWIDNTLIAPQDFSPAAKTLDDKEILRNVDEVLKKDLSHIKDWDSLNVLLPKEIREAVHGHYVPRSRTAPKQQRPKSCDAGVLMREQRTQRSQRSSGYRGSSTITWTESGGFALPTVPQSPPSPHSPFGEVPPPLPKRTASLPANRDAAAAAKPETEPPQQPKRLTVAKNRQHELSHAVVNKPKTLSLPKQSSDYEDRTEMMTPNLRKTVSFGEHLCSGLSGGKFKSKSRPLSVSNMEVDYDIADADEIQKNATCNLDRMKGLVQEASVAAAQLCRLMHQSLINDEDEDSSLLMKHISRTITGKLSPALYEILSDGLLPSVSTFFGQVTNSVWRVVEASVKKAPTLPWIEELVFCLNNEESLPEGPIRFGVFVAELVNMGAVDWWLDNLACKEAIIRRHYAPGGFLYLCHTSTRGLMQDLKTALKPLAALPLDCSIPWSAEVPWKSKSAKTTPQKTTPTKTTPTMNTPTKTTTPTKPTTPTKTTPTRGGNTRMQRPLSCVESPSRSAAAKAGYRRAQSQQQMTGAVVTEKAEPFSSLKNKWEKLSSQKKSEQTTLEKKAEANVNPSPIRSRIPRPVSRVLK